LLEEVRQHQAEGLAESVVLTLQLAVVMQVRLLVMWWTGGLLKASVVHF
jgi:hypothetical protein